MSVWSRKKAVFFMVLAFACAGPATAQQVVANGKRPLTLEDLWKVKRPGKPAISPDGQWVAVEVTHFSLDDNNSQSDLWLLATEGKTQRQLTSAKGKNAGPVWSPDGKTIAFISSRSGEVSQIHAISPGGGEARQVSKLPMSAGGLKWGPDGKTLYCVVRTWPDTPDDASYKKKEKAQKESKVQAYIIDDALFRYWDHWIADGKRPVVFAVDVDTGKHRNLFAGLKLNLPIAEAGTASFDISPDGKEICFTADSTKEIGTDFNLDLYTMSLEKPGEPKNITRDNPGNDSDPLYSPDGKRLAFSRQTIKFFYADRKRLVIRDRASGKVFEAMPNFDFSIGSVNWLGNSEELIFDAEVRGYHPLHYLGLHLDNPAPVVWEPGPTLTSLQTSKDGKTTVLLKSSFDYPTQVALRKNGAPNLRRLDRFNDDLRAEWRLGQVNDVKFKGADDEDVQMWIVFPPDFNLAKKWPLLMVVHGGPHNGITSDFHFRWNAHLLASKGYVVAIPNFHGSSGFGQRFTDSITGDMASKPFTDIMKATDFMEKFEYIDKDRMAAAGASYGGYMMAWLNGHTDRFKAMICHAGVYNWHSMMASDIVRSRERPLGALPWGDLARIDKQSPQRFTANFKTPTLIMHGEKDYRVPVTQGFEYYTTLRLKGVPTRLVYFPDENHWIMKPQNSRLWHREFFAWLDKHIGHGPTK